MKMCGSTEIRLVFVLVCFRICFGAAQQVDAKAVSVLEGEDAILYCYFKENLENGVVNWKNQNQDEVLFLKEGQHINSDQHEQYRGRASLIDDELKSGNASMILRDTRIEDTGTYTCILPKLKSGLHETKMELFVIPVFKNRFGLKGAVLAPVLSISDVTEAGVELKCVVRGSSSNLSVNWETCEGITLNVTGQRHNATELFVAVTETASNCFRCVAKQEDIYHRIDEETTVPGKLFEKKSCNDTRGHSTPGIDCFDLGFSWIAGVVSAVFLFFLVMFILLYFCLSWIITFHKNKNRRPETMNMKNGTVMEQENLIG